MKVEHGQYFVNGHGVGDKKVTLKLDLSDELLEHVLNAVWLAVTAGGGDPATLRHITAEISFEQSHPGRYEPKGGKVVGVHG